MRVIGVQVIVRIHAPPGKTYIPEAKLALLVRFNMNIS